MKKRKINLIVISLLITIFFTLVYYFTHTTSGSSFIVKSLLKNYFEPEKLEIKTIKGSFSDVLTFQNIEIEDVYGLPQGSILKIQKLDTRVVSFGLGGVFLDVFNGRLFLPNSDPILIQGDFKNGILNLNAYSKQVGLRALFDLFAENKALKNISGVISDLDIDIKGSFLEPQLTGNFFIKQLSHNGFSILDGPGKLSLNLKDIKDDLGLNGEIIINSGMISAYNTIITIQPSKIIFLGNPKNPSFDFKGISNIEKTKINISLKGTIDRPEIKLTSNPQKAQEKLLIMLATGKGWSRTESGIKKGQLTPDVAADFIDYFVFGGSGSKLARQFGISRLSVKFDKNTKGFGVTKEVTNKTEVSYGVEQTQIEGQNGKATQKVGAGYKLTNTISLEGEREVQQQDKASQTQDESKSNDKLILKYEKKF